MKRVKTKYKKLLLELEFLYSDLDYHNDVQEEAMREFHKAFGTYCKENNINYESDLIKEEERKIQVSDPDKVTFRDEDGNPTREDIKEIENSSRPEEIRKKNTSRQVFQRQKVRKVAKYAGVFAGKSGRRREQLLQITANCPTIGLRFARNDAKTGQINGKRGQTPTQYP